MAPFVELHARPLQRRAAAGRVWFMAAPKPRVRLPNAIAAGDPIPRTDPSKLYQQADHASHNKMG